jgi:endonuclease/exonuclease/phosphatase family metal-dependent hydrolase
MPDFPKPAFPFQYTVSDEIGHLRQHKVARGIPAKSPSTLLLATWNIANFGTQDRRDQDKQLLAEILSWFDIIAVQEVKDNFGDLMDVQHILGPSYRVLMSDTAGNDERLAFLYDQNKVVLQEKVGEISIPQSDLQFIKLPGNSAVFKAFDRTPYLAAWQAGTFSFLLVNVHLFFGSASPANVDRRALETYAVARWADLRIHSPFVFTRDMIVLGDFNMPKAVEGNPIFDALTRKTLEIPAHTSIVGSSIASDNQYDQIAFIPEETQAQYTGLIGVFDYDDVIFPELWAQQTQENFNAYLRYYISDHRPMWMQFAI